MQTVLANTLGDAVRPQISTIFVDGFYQWLNYFSKDKAKLERTFRHIFNLDVFHLALDADGTILGMAACTDGEIPAVRLDKREFRTHLGFFTGSFAYMILRREFEKKQYPFPIAKGMGVVEFVAVSARHRGQGVAAQMIRDIFTATPYTEYVLEVADTNTPAVKTYEKLGFAEFMRMPQNPAAAKRSGVNAFVYMKNTLGE